MHDQNAIPAPFDQYRADIRPEWIDYNGHMNVAYYVLVFDYATDVFWSYLGIGEEYLKRTNHSTFALESHVSYRGEVKLGDRVRVTSLLLGVDAKRLHFFHRMYHAEQGYLAATLESICLHVDLAAPGGAPRRALPGGALRVLPAGPRRSRNARRARRDRAPHQHGAPLSIALILSSESGHLHADLLQSAADAAATEYVVQLQRKD